MSDYSQLLSENKALKEEVERLKLLVPKVSPTQTKGEAKVVEAKGSAESLYAGGVSRYSYANAPAPKPYVAKSTLGSFKSVKGR